MRQQPGNDFKEFGRYGAPHSLKPAVADAEKVLSKAHRTEIFRHLPQQARRQRAERLVLSRVACGFTSIRTGELADRMYVLAAGRAALIGSVFVSNFPEALSSAAGMRAQGFGRLLVVTMWTGVLLVAGLSVTLGSLALDDAPPELLSVGEGIAAGAGSRRADPAPLQMGEGIGSPAIWRWRKNRMLLAALSLRLPLSGLFAASERSDRQVMGVDQSETEHVMSGLSKKERFKILEMVSEIASEAAKNPSVGSMAEFQNDFIESLYNTMAGLVDEDREEAAEFEEDAEEEEEQENWDERDSSAV
ncbi:MAG: hypothetical protein MUF20_05925 [Methylotetracoccus sp.]|nr:hypothetical protein [Methylotetracoccus sp.]